MFNKNIQNVLNKNEIYSYLNYFKKIEFNKKFIIIIIFIKNIIKIYNKFIH